MAAKFCSITEIFTEMAVFWAAFINISFAISGISRIVWANNWSWFAAFLAESIFFTDLFIARILTLSSKWVKLSGVWAAAATFLFLSGEVFKSF